MTHRQSQPVIVYTPESRLRHPVILLREMRRDLLASRGLAWQLLVRDIKAQYRQSLLGVFWAFFATDCDGGGVVGGEGCGGDQCGGNVDSLSGLCDV